MPVQMLFYAQVAPVNPQRHRDLSVKAGDTYAFAAAVNSVPLLTVEFARAALEYPIVFAGGPGEMLPVAVLGLRSDRNLYLAADGRWDAQYIPAFVRRYPFVFSTADGGGTFTLCVDEDFAGCNREGRGERLFDALGERTQYLQGVLGFATEYQAQFQRTRAFCESLQGLGLLEPMQATFHLASGTRPALSGFHGVNRERLRGLEGEKLLDLARGDDLELIHAHLHSLHNFQALARRAGDQVEGDGHYGAANGGNAGGQHGNGADNAG